MTKWYENPNGTSSYLVGEDDYGDLWICPWNSRKDGEPQFTRRFKKYNPLCWGAWYRSWRQGMCTFLTTRDWS